jgi:hypothetical protein
MKYNPEIHHRKTVRLKEYDYSQAGYYFVTICTHKREKLFGEIKDGKNVLNEFGKVSFKVVNVLFGTSILAVIFDTHLNSLFPSGFENEQLNPFIFCCPRTPKGIKPTINNKTNNQYFVGAFLCLRCGSKLFSKPWLGKLSASRLLPFCSPFKFNECGLINQRI